MRKTIRGILTGLTLVIAYGATAEADIILVTPGLFAAGRDVWCVATNFATKPQFVTTQIIQNGVLLTPDNTNCNAPIAPGLTCFAQVFDVGGGATLCLFAVKTRKVVGTAQILDDNGHLITVVPAIKP